MLKVMWRHQRGSLLGMTALLAVVIILIGCALFYIIKIIGGDRQVVNATDAGALSAAKTVLAISIPQTKIAPEFQGMGVNIPPDPNNPSLAAGAPDAINGKYNILSYNRAAGAAALIAMNALEEANNGSNNAIDNANAMINGNDLRPGLQQFGDALNDAIIASGQTDSASGRAFQSIATQNNISMMGDGSATNLTGDLTFSSVTTGANGTNGKSNIYFNTAYFGADPFYSNTVTACQDSSGSVSSVAQPDANAPSYAAQPVFQEGQPLLKAYDPIVIDPNISPIYLCAVNPSATPHLIDAGRFNAGAARFGQAPVNALSGQTQIMENRSHTLTNALACALVGSIYNQYPVTLVHGYVRIYNGPDARTANPALANIYGSVDGSNNIFNNALYSGQGGGGGVCQSDNGLFGSLWSGAQAEMAAWQAYNNSQGQPGLPPTIYYSGAGAGHYNVQAFYQHHIDPLGHDPWLDPTHGEQWGVVYPQSSVLQMYGPYPDSTIRSTGNLNQFATLAEMRNIHNAYAVPLCTSTMFPDNGPCDANLAKWEGNYGTGITHDPVPPGVTLTDLEAFKGELITKWTYATTATAGFNATYSFATTGSEFSNPSGSKVYSRKDVPYAVYKGGLLYNPAQAQDVAFGTVSSPGKLLEQLYNYGANNVNVNDVNQWRDPTSVLCGLLQRCQEILPSADWIMVRNLLYTPSDKTPGVSGVGYAIDLGQAQYIYLPPGSNKLAISQSPPAFLSGVTATLPVPDGKPYKGQQYQSIAQDADFSASAASDRLLNNMVNAQVNSVPGNERGDNGLEDQPFEVFSGKADTYDYATWVASSGTNNILGQLSFFNHVSADGTFSQPN